MSYKKKKSHIYLDLWDFLIIGLFLFVGWVVYMTPAWELQNPTDTVVFIMTIADKTVGWFFGGFILKKILERAEKQ